MRIIGKLSFSDGIRSVLNTPSAFLHIFICTTNPSLTRLSFLSSPIPILPLHAEMATLTFRLSKSNSLLDVPKQKSPRASTSAKAASTSVERLECFLKDWPKTRWIQLYWWDHAYTIDRRAITIDDFRDLLQHSRPYEVGKCHYSPPSRTQSWMSTNNDSMANVEVTLSVIPDLDSLKPFAGNEEMACVFCYWKDDYHPPKHPSGAEQGPGPVEELKILGNTLSTMCPRAALRRAELAASRAGLKIQLGIEFDYVVINPLSLKMPPFVGPQELVVAPVYPRGEEPWRVPYRYVSDLVMQVRAKLEQSKIDIREWGPVNSEKGHTQIKVKLEPQSPLAAIDAFIYARDSIRDLFSRRSWAASLQTSPSRMTDMFRLHISVHPQDDPAHAMHTESYDGSEHFLAGMLDHLPGLCALGKSTIFSYFTPGNARPWPGQAISWGTGNHHATMRVIEPHHWEIKPVDALAPLPLMAAGYIFSGLDGVRRCMKPAYQELLCESCLFRFP